MKTLRIGINGFGRIGRTLFKILQKHPGIEVVAINDVADLPTLVHLLKYDSIHGPFTNEIQTEDSGFTIDGNTTQVVSHALPSEIPWDKMGVSLVVETSGRFKTKAELSGHLRKGVKKVVLSAPSLSADVPMIVYGINDHLLRKEDQIISAASCTTHNAAPMISIIEELCGIEQAYITTVHSYTSDQSLHDRPHRDLRRARAAATSIIPTTTGAAKALTRIFPDLAQVIGGCGIRVPVANGSLTDITFNVCKKTDIEEINDIFKEKAQGSMKEILFYTEDPIVSVDINNSCYSCTFDSSMTSVIGKMVKVIGWYDNETGYSNRLADTLSLLIERDYI